MKNIIDKLTKVLADVQQAIERLDINSDEARLKTLESEMSKGDFWQDQAKAEQVSQEAVGLKKIDQGLARTRSRSNFIIGAGENIY